MKPTDRDPLLEEVFAETADSAFRSALLDQTISQARRRQRHRRIARNVMAIAIFLGVIATVAIQRRMPSTTLAHRETPSAAVHSSGNEAQVITVISDEELLASFPAGAVALVGPPENRRLVGLAP